MSALSQLLASRLGFWGPQTFPWRLIFGGLLPSFLGLEASPQQCFHLEEGWSGPGAARHNHALWGNLQRISPHAWADSAAH